MRVAIVRDGNMMAGRQVLVVLTYYLPHFTFTTTLTYHLTSLPYSTTISHFATSPYATYSTHPTY